MNVVWVTVPHACPKLVESRSLHAQLFHHHALSDEYLVWLMDQHCDTLRGGVPDICFAESVIGML